MKNRLGRVAVVGAMSLALAIAGVLIVGFQASAHESRLTARLRDAAGRNVGTVEFRIGRYAMTVTAELWPNRYVKADQFHGFHVHANDDPANGSGCVANPALSPSTWFVSADGHLSEPGQSHGGHAGDLPSPLVLADGTARLRFTTDRIDPEQLRRRAVVLHDKPDNFGNVPVGPSPNQYTPNSSAAPDATARTGNAGDRVACGLIRRHR